MPTDEEKHWCEARLICRPNKGEPCAAPAKRQIAEHWLCFAHHESVKRGIRTLRDVRDGRGGGPAGS